MAVLDLLTETSGPWVFYGDWLEVRSPFRRRSTRGHFDISKRVSAIFHLARKENQLEEESTSYADPNTAISLLQGIFCIRQNALKNVQNGRFGCHMDRRVMLAGSPMIFGVVDICQG
jgi:hypothetical protein